MKVNLVVSSGVHQGRMIAVTGNRFLIGRDPECQLRPASQAVSKRHCEVIIRDGKVFLKDYGSTNGTLHNDKVLQDAELELTNNDRIKVGPLDFIVRVEPSGKPAAATPMPADAGVEALAAVKAVATPGKPAGAGTKTPAPPKSPAPETAANAALGSETPGGDEQDRIAAMLLGMGGDDDVPEGSTVMDMSMKTIDPVTGEPIPEKPKPAGAPAQDSVSAANDLLMKMRKRSK
jgi:predicted component of type VI protein secretion system